jgi:hypothetical protein
MTSYLGQRSAGVISTVICPCPLEVSLLGSYRQTTVEEDVADQSSTMSPHLDSSASVLSTIICPDPQEVSMFCWTTVEEDVVHQSSTMTPHLSVLSDPSVMIRREIS